MYRILRAESWGNHIVLGATTAVVVHSALRRLATAVREELSSASGRQRGRGKVRAAAPPDRYGLLASTRGDHQEFRLPVTNLEPSFEAIGAFSAGLRVVADSVTTPR